MQECSPRGYANPDKPGKLPPRALDTSPPGDARCGQGVLLSQMWRVSTRTRLDVSQKEGPHQAGELRNCEEHVHQNIGLPEDTAWGF